ncbi:TetR/AcrR family transcriptional regulator [Microbacterium sp. NPDC058062]|uniref:TetR/AcrR family transcriptional regulator n=1 Tax=Microbacterium sp. NPDC058062 TaxID=3346320 RepID=UPI0036DB9AE0
MTGAAPEGIAPQSAVAPRQWKSSAKIRQSIVDAAREQFSAIGYEQTSIQDIVDSSGVSVGSIYHHVGGKAAIFTAVATDVIHEQAEASRRAIATALAEEEHTGLELYLIGARAYLMASWRNRRVTGAILGDDRPAGFDRVEESLMERMAAGTRDITLGQPPTPSASARAVTALLRAAAEELVGIEDQASAESVVSYFLQLLRRLAQDTGPWGHLPP